MTQQQRERALSLLSMRPHSRSELNRKLIQKGIPEEDAAEICDWLVELGFLNDQNYAAMVVRRYAEKGYGAQRIRSELSRRGVPRECWEEALIERSSSSDKIDRYLSSRLQHPHDQRERRKLSAALLRRGFSPEEIRSAFSRVTDASTDTDWTE